MIDSFTNVNRKERGHLMRVFGVGSLLISVVLCFTVYADDSNVTTVLRDTLSTNVAVPSADPVPLPSKERVEPIPQPLPSQDNSTNATSAVDTNALSSRASETNLAPVRLIDTNSPALVDTNSPGFGSLEIGPPIREPRSTAKYDLQSFRIIAERNIFNPNRRPARYGGPIRRYEPERRVRTETLSLLGTMSYEKGDFAFFEGSRSDFRQVLKPTDTIAGYKIAEITPNHVKLEGTNGSAIELPVGGGMKKVEDEAWRVVDQSGITETAISAPAPTTSTSSNAPSEKPTESTTSSGESDVLKRLLEKREQELNK